MATQMGGGNFPTTDWGLFADVRGGSTGARVAALDILSRRYWRPVFVFLRRFGHDEETANSELEVGGGYEEAMVL